MSTILLTHWPAPWLTGPWDVNRTLVVRALCDVGIEEDPPGSNRGREIDDYCRRAACDLGSYWCAAALTAWCQDAGAATPSRDEAACQAWLDWARGARTTTLTPQPGSIVLYLNDAGLAHHCGVVVRTSPEVFTMEGNTSRQPGDRNGVAALVKPLSPGAVVYITPTLTLAPSL